MLIEFSVSNYRSFRDKQTLSMVAASRLHKTVNKFSAPVQGEHLPDLLKVAVIYGPNAAGKTNLIKALGVVGQIASRVSGSLPVTPFKFDSHLRDQPSAFEIHFLSGGLRYEFMLEATPQRITLERLKSYPKGKETLLYERRYDGQREHYDFGATLEGKALHEIWRKLTPPHALFIAQAVANSDEEQVQLRQPFNWLARGVLDAGDPGDFTEDSLALVREGFGDEIAAFLYDVDVPVTKIHVAPAPSGEDKQTGIGNALRMLISPPISVRDTATFTHTTALGSADLGFEDESRGTQNLIGFWLPWGVRKPGDKGERSLLTVDEFDASLHPTIVAALVKKHIEAPSPTQLIFTTHDTHLMDSKLLRRDQIWIAERDRNGATQLRCIHDFEGREGEDIEKRYYEGRYRGLPLVRA